MVCLYSGYRSGTLETIETTRMTQLFPTTAQVIYEAVSIDPYFTGLLGTYNFKTTSSPSTSLSIVSAGEDMPSIRNVQGIECIIQDTGDVTTQPYLTEEPDLVITWSVFLVAWEPAKGSNMQEVVNYFLRRFVGAEAVQTVATTDGLGALVQTKVFIKSNMPIRTI